AYIGGATYVTSVAAGAAAAGGDPAVGPVLSSPVVPDPVQPPGQFARPLTRPATLSAGAVQGQVQAASVRATNQIAAAWSSSATSGFEIASLTASNATIRNSANQVVGTGAAGLTLAAPIPASISGATNYSVTGIGDLSFYGPATGTLGVSGNWSNY